MDAHRAPGHKPECGMYHQHQGGGWQDKSNRPATLSQRAAECFDVGFFFFVFANESKTCTFPAKLTELEEYYIMLLEILIVASIPPVSFDIPISHRNESFEGVSWLATIFRGSLVWSENFCYYSRGS